jgi:hypothetical protein
MNVHDQPDTIQGDSAATTSPGGGMSPTNLVALAQGIYYFITGVWSLIHLRSFQKVTGPKTDLWLVKTVGVIVGVIGIVLCVSGLRQRTPPEVPLLAIGSAAGLTGIDVVYVAKGRISPIYLLDALAELLLIAAWVVALADEAGSEQ